MTSDRLGIRHRDPISGDLCQEFENLMVQLGDQRRKNEPLKEYSIAHQVKHFIKIYYFENVIYRCAFSF